MDKEKDYITEEKKVALEQELEDLKGPKRKEILETLAYAKSLGDLSENAEYHQAREDQAKLEEKIKQLEHLLKNCEVVPAGSTSGDVVGIGSTVVVKKEGDSKETTYTIVGSQESDMSTGKISNRSPLGSTLFGKKKGEKVVFETPRGVVNYEIIDVS